MLARIRRSPFLRGVVARLGAGYIRLIMRTTRWRYDGEANRDALRSGRGKWIVPVWHGRVMLIPGERTKVLNATALISANRDGDIIAACVERFGVPAIRGSSRDRRKPDKEKGGAEVAAEAVALLTGPQDATLVLTPDGPRGPRMRCQPGVAAISARTGVAVMPFACAVNPGVLLSSWDRFLLPLPFGRGGIVFGDPIPAPADQGRETLEAHRRRIEEALNDVTRRADLLAGREPVEPAPEPAA